MSLARNLKEARIKRKITQEELAKLLGKSKNVVSNWERGDNKPDADTLFELCDILKVDANFLLGWEHNKTLSLSIHEQEHMKKYRSLDPLDKKAVDGLLDTLSEREKQFLKDISRETEHAYLVEDNRLYMTQYDYGVSAGIGNFLDEWDVPKATVEISDSPIAHQADYILKVDGDSMTPKYEDGDRVFVKAQESIDLNEIGIFVIDGKCFLKQYKGDCLHSLNSDYNDISFNENQNIKCVGKVLGKV